MNDLVAWAGAFAGTVAVEMTALALLLPGRRDPGRLALLANAVTHPALWVAVSRAPRYGTALATAEVAATIVEAAILAALVRDARPRAVAAVVVANGLSFLIGWLGPA